MQNESDLFGGELTPSFPPHLDPARASVVRVRPDVDRDFVGSAEVGKYGNNARVFVFEVLDARDVVLYAQSYEDEEAAQAQVEHHLAALMENRQRELF